MNTSQQLSDYIFFYPDALDSKTCNWIINRYETTAKWKDSTFATAYNNTGDSKVSMKEYWIGKPSPYHKEIKEAFNYCVDDYVHFSRACIIICGCTCRVFPLCCCIVTIDYPITSF